MRVIHRGEPGTIINMGNDIVGESSARHIKIYYDDHRKGKDSVRIHENTINRYLKKRKAFWPDWTSIEKYTED